NTQVFYLNYANAADMVPILESVSGSVVKATEKDAPQADVEVSIQALEANNALIITAPPSLLNTMRGVIAKLDVRRAQVLVEALIVEVNSDFDRDLGVSWISDPVTGDGGRASFGSPSIPSVNPNNFGPSGTFAGGLAVGVFRDGSLRGLLNVLEADGDTNVLSTPTVIALDNEEAEILVGQNVPFKTGQEDRSGTDNDFVTIEREDVGISLKVKPRVNNDNSLTLEIEQKVESVEESGTADASDIITNKREIRTKALVKNNEILVLGGLMSDTIEVNTSKVPFFGDIPVIGHLFKSSSKKKVKQNLMVFIHPVILLDDVTTESESGRRYNEIRELQRDFNDQENWLQIKKSALPLLPEYKTEVESNTDSVADMPVEDPAIMNP
ncbi:MAG: hypothetical protein KDI30_01175, partial [Pseudomonadales bacterium]|nr:hypothetical protein [Pseudomonadales bacterium]